MKLTYIVLSIVLFGGSITGMDPDLEAQLKAQPTPTESALLADLMSEYYGVSSSEAKEGLLISLHQLPVEKQQQFFKLLTKRNNRKSTKGDETSKELIKALVKGLETSAELQRKSGETAKRQLRFTQCGAVTGLIGGIVTVLVSNLLNYYLTH